MVSRYEKFYRTEKPLDWSMQEMDQMIQLVRPVWDGDLISKKDRDTLVSMEFAVRLENGFNVLTKHGFNYLILGGWMAP